MFLHISCESEKLESENLEEDTIKLTNNNLTEEPERKNITKNNPSQTTNTSKKDKLFFERKPPEDIVVKAKLKESRSLMFDRLNKKIIKIVDKK